MKADVLFLIVNILFCFAAMHLFDLAEGHIHTVYCRLAITPDLPQSYHVCFPFVNNITNRYMSASPRLLTPCLPSSVVKKIILNGGEEELKPERRFDQTLYFTAKGKL